MRGDIRHTAAGHHLADWLVDLELDNKTIKTIYGYAGYVTALLLMFPDVPFDGFTHTEVKRYLSTVPERSRHIVRSVLNRWFEWGELEDRIGKSPMGKVQKIRAPHDRPRDVFTSAEAGVLQNLPYPDGQLMTILFGSGIRRGEARRLRLRDVSLDRARIYIYLSKGKKDRIIAVDADVVLAVSDLKLGERLDPDGHLWYTKRGQRRLHRDPIGDTTFHSWWARCIEAAGVRYLNPHQTRHTYGYELSSRGLDVIYRQSQLGHEDPRTTQRYDRVTIERVEQAMAELQR